MSVEVKICGLGRSSDARAAEAAGADYLGVVFGAGPRRRSRPEARRIWAGVRARRVGVFVDPSREQALALARELGLAVVQLHGDESPEFCSELQTTGDWAIWKAIRLSAEGSFAAEIARYAEHVDGILLEGKSPRGRGGVGARFDWSLAEALRNDWPDGRRMIVAGGLTPANVAEVIERLRPDVVDVSSGVEASVGVKDPELMRAFVAAARKAAAG